MRLQVNHRTTYQYQSAVTLGQNQLRITPRNFRRQRCLASRITIEPVPTTRRAWRDAFGNDVTYFTLEEPHTELTVEADAVVDVVEGSRLPEYYSHPWDAVREMLIEAATAESLDAQPFLFNSPQVLRSREAYEYAAPSFPAGGSLADGVGDLTRRIFSEFRYDPTATTIHTTIDEVFRDRHGVCQDFAHLQIACLRSLGLAARYVSGYLLTKPAPGKTKLVGSDASHAWVSVFFPELGWVDVDPTNNQAAGEEHVTLGWGRDYSDIAPIRGLVLGGGGCTLSVSVDVAEVM